ncbi:NAD(P)/FAD-dependent oxidoreductase [Tropicimonas sp. IMCC34043]|uniref:NAD(P)/FAD-dependent oxidoreductase n=1 Tax=Tropicimonas sp. IMCC34043 TaxID=2248760 RepID=UPI000E243687|nr:NAD(P)/FAD-dependent oxidoreductase [Tropicimonas sp. IMCC34043]
MQIDTLILGAGAAGLMCAAHAGGRCLVIDHAEAAGEKIRISGGGRCNFTNIGTSAENFFGQNPHFCKSALSRYTQWDFLDLVARHGIAWHEKTLGQLFCDGSARQIVQMLLDEMAAAGADLWLQTEVVEIARADGGFAVTLRRNGRDIGVAARRLVVATGGKSIPKMGASGFGYRIAAQFDIPVTETRPALVPLTFGGPVLDQLRALAGIATEARVTCNGESFREALLFTHRGLSGPAILQISTCWREGDAIEIDLAPGTDVAAALAAERSRHGRQSLARALGAHLPVRLATQIVADSGLSGNLADQSDTALAALNQRISAWRLTPTGSEGYRTAEVTLGGIDTGALSARTMECRAVPGLYFIGECVDVTGWLGGYNFQWAWSSGWAAGTAIASA